MVGSNEGFFSNGVTKACLSGEGTMPLDRERLKTWVRERRIEVDGDRSRFEGIGSRGQVVKWDVDRSEATSSVVTGSNKESDEGGGW